MGNFYTRLGMMSIEQDPEVCKKVRALLDKIEPRTQKKLSKQFVALTSDNKAHLGKIVDIIIEKAVENPKKCSLYAKLCDAQLNADPFVFGCAILNRMQNAMNNRKPGLVPFIVQLLEQKVVGRVYVQVCIHTFLSSCVWDGKNELTAEHIEQESVFNGMQLIELAGAELDTVYLDSAFQTLDAFKVLFNGKNWFKLRDLVELRANRWVPPVKKRSKLHKLEELDVASMQIINVILRLVKAVVNGEIDATVVVGMMFHMQTAADVGKPSLARVNELAMLLYADRLSREEREVLDKVLHEAATTSPEEIEAKLPGSVLFG